MQLVGDGGRGMFWFSFWTIYLVGCMPCFFSLPCMVREHVYVFMGPTGARYYGY